MTRPLVSLPDHLAPLLAGLRPVAPVRVPLREAENHVAAEDVVAPVALPAGSVALRSGLAVNAVDCAGASPQSPVPLPSPPMKVTTGETLPSGCDAILDPAAFHTGRFGTEVYETVEPGAWVRLTGEDLAAGEPIVKAGRRITSGQILAAAIAGTDNLTIRRPMVQLDWDDSPERDWLVSRISAAGALLAPAGSAANLLLRSVVDGQQRLALAPGAAAWAERMDGIIDVSLPSRFDALYGAWCALVLPILMRLAGAAPNVIPVILTRKIASTVGWTEVALLRLEGRGAHPLAVGQATLGGIVRADAFAVLEPASEGAPAGGAVTAISLDRPF